MTGIGARFGLRVGRLLDPPIPLYPVDPRPLPMALDNEFGAGVEQNNPSEDTAENNNDVAFLDAFAVLPAVDDHVEADDNDAMLNASLGPLADANNMDLTPTLPGLLADGIGAPPASRSVPWPLGRPEQLAGERRRLGGGSR